MEDRRRNPLHGDVAEGETDLETVVQRPYRRHDDCGVYVHTAKGEAVRKGRHQKGGRDRRV